MNQRWHSGPSRDLRGSGTVPCLDRRITVRLRRLVRNNTVPGTTTVISQFGRSVDGVEAIGHVIFFSGCEAGPRIACTAVS